MVLDAGCGAGRYLEQLGSPTVGLDAAAALLDIACQGPTGPVEGRTHAFVRGDLEALPFGAWAFDGVFAHHSYLHLPPERAPHAFGEAARVLVPGGTILLSMIAGAYAGRALPGDDFPGRWYSLWVPDALAGALVAAGFADVEVTVTEGRHRELDLVATATRR